jgi:hypothetical protein
MVVKGSAALTTRPAPRGLCEVLPNLLRDKVSLQFKHPELQSYISGLDERRFYDKAYLEGVKAHMEQHRLQFWKRVDVTITIDPALSSSAKPRLTAHGVPWRVLEFYHSYPRGGDHICVVMQQGSNLKPWVMRCGSSEGVHGIKRAARMIAVIKEHVDPDFDAEGDSPAPPIGVPNVWSQNRKRKMNSMIREMNSSSEALPSPEYYDADLEEETPANKVQRVTEVEETTKLK